MGADGFFAFFESRLRDWLPTLVFIKFHPEKNLLHISISGVNDFVIVAMAASSANISCELSVSFAGKLEDNKRLDSCALGFKLSNNCLDVRLAFFLYEVFGMAVIKGPLELGHNKQEWEEIRSWECWLSSKCDKSP